MSRQGAESKEGYSRGVIPPTQEQIAEANKATGPVKKSNFWTRAGAGAAAFLGIGGFTMVLDACATKPPTIEVKTPTSTPEPKATLVPTLVPTEAATPISTKTPEATETATPTPEAITFPGLTITEEFLVNGLANMGGGETPSVDGEESEVKPEMSPMEYAKKAWRTEELNLKDPVDVLKLLVAEGAYIGADKTTYRTGFEGLTKDGEPLRFYRVKIKELPGGVSEIKINPDNTDEGTLKKETDITPVALLNDGKNVLIAYTDYADSSENENIPAHKFAILPLTETEGRVSLEPLGIVQKGEQGIEFVSQGQKTIWETNGFDEALEAEIAASIKAQNQPEPTPTATVVPTETPTPTPEVSPIEQAIKAGRLELKGEQDWEKYFEAITPEEAQKLLTEVNTEGKTDSEFKYILPFDPRGISNLVLENFTDARVDGRKTNHLTVNNLPLGTIFYASVDGEATVYNNVVSSDGDLTIAWLVNVGGDQHTEVYTGMLIRNGTKFFLQPSQPTEVKLGTPLVSVGNNDRFLEGYQTLIGFGRNVFDITNGTLENLLRKEKSGKILFIPQNK
ncbi:MAG: hypothetical protein M1524_00910 [Patescibacteria group bacterium]|nr:hypothetical protein [Patescibacteria group bacterium]